MEEKLKALEAANAAQAKEIEELKAENADLKSKITALQDALAVEQAKVEALEASVSDTPVVVAQDDVLFTVKGVKYRFAVPTFILNATKRTAKEVAKDAKLCAEIVEKYPGIVGKI